MNPPQLQLNMEPVSLQHISSEFANDFLNNTLVSSRVRQLGMRYFIEEYIHGVTMEQTSSDIIQIGVKCYRSMRKSGKPHMIVIDISVPLQTITNCMCSCVAG